MGTRFNVILSHSRGDELCGGATTRTLAIEVAQRVLVATITGPVAPKCWRRSR